MGIKRRIIYRDFKNILLTTVPFVNKGHIQTDLFSLSRLKQMLKKHMAEMPDVEQEELVLRHHSKFKVSKVMVMVMVIMIVIVILIVIVIIIVIVIGEHVIVNPLTS
jgi:hypothetical protein